MPMQLLVGPYALSGMNRNVRDIETPGDTRYFEGEFKNGSSVKVKLRALWSRLTEKWPNE
ncbi:hypothetical protein GCM10027203_21220 [Nonomuraea fastidiosa]